MDDSEKVLNTFCTEQKTDFLMANVIRSNDNGNTHYCYLTFKTELTNC